MDDSTPTREWPAQEWEHQVTPVDPDTPMEHRFLLRLRDAPADLETRMVFADWLEQTGQAQKAEIVRLFAEVPVEGSAAAHRLRVLLDVVDDEWIAIVSRAPIEKCDSPFNFQCPKAWEALTPTDNAAVRHCGTCNEEVYFCSSLAQIRSHASAEHCVAFSSKLLRREGLATYEAHTSDMMVMGDIAPDHEWLDDMPTGVR